MENTNQPKRRRSIRLKHYDYSQAGLYFVTICTKNRIPLLGKVSDQKMQHSDCGRIAADCWGLIPNQFPGIVLHEYIIMPNHMHGIIEIADMGSSMVDKGAINRASTSNTSPSDCGSNPVGARFIAPIPPHATSSDCGTDPCRGAIYRAQAKAKGFAGNESPMITGGLAQIIRWYKGRVTYECRKINKSFSWQRNYYEHIIRNPGSHHMIADYIADNPARWQDDKYFCEVCP